MPNCITNYLHKSYRIVAPIIHVPNNCRQDEVRYTPNRERNGDVYCVNVVKEPQAERR